MITTTRRRATTAVVAATTVLALTAPAASAAPPSSFSGTAEALTLDLRIQAPEALLGSVAPNGAVHQQVSQTISTVVSGETADAAVNLLSGLLNESAASTGNGTHRQEIAAQNVAGLVDVGVGLVEYTTDVTAGLSESFSELAHLRVSLAPLFAPDSPLPAEVREGLTDAVQDVTDQVNGLTGELNGVLGEVEGVVNEVNESAPIDIPSVLPDELPKVPDITKVSLVEINKLWSRSSVKSIGDAVVSESASGIVEASLLGGLVRVPAFQYTSLASANGQPGGAFADASTKVISVILADDTLVEVAGSVLTVGDFTLDLNDPQLGDLPLGDLLNEVEGILGEILNAVGLSISQGETSTSAEEDGSAAEAATSAFAISLYPLNAIGANDVFSLDLELLPTRVKAAANNVDPVAPPAPEPPVNLPRTGGGAAILLGAVALAGAFGLRRSS